MNQSAAHGPHPRLMALGSSDYAGLEVIPLRHPTYVTFETDEVTAVCPVTGQPDWYTVTINLSLTYASIESKSLKLYLQSFRDKGIFCEDFASTIFGAVYDCLVVKAGQEAGLSVILVQKPRGGITLRAERTGLFA